MSVDSTQLAIQTVRMLAVDAVEKADSGHPGMPMGAADYAVLLWTRYLKYSASNPKWANRDRFVLSPGHGSMLLYSLLHLAGFDVSLHDLQNFRQWQSKTPGHPEYFRTPGVETTTGPLGQGSVNAVGMAMAAKMMAARFNREDFSPIDHKVYAIVSDGDLMEGVASEGASIAGHLKLNNLIFIYDDNKISIDGSTDQTFTEDVAKRFEAYGWWTKRIDGHNHEEILKALDEARSQTDKPSIILARTHIGFGAPTKQDTAEAHGSPLGKAEVEATKKAIGWPLEPTFHIPSEVKDLFAKRTAELEAEHQRWEGKLLQWREKHADLSKLWDQHWLRKTSETLFQDLCQVLPKMPNATRSISSELEQVVAKATPSLVGGSADLNGSTKTAIKGSSDLAPKAFEGRNIHFGIREHAMGAIQNGLALYGSFIPFGSTFLQFADYMRPAIRLAALSQIQTIYVFTHDSIFLGEDGPTHQPIEHLAALRLIPNLAVIRPADSLECAAAWQIAMKRREGPTAICLTRQKIPAIERPAGFEPRDVLRGAYAVIDHDKPDLILIATGSELFLAINAAKKLAEDGKKVRVVSMPCESEFEKEGDLYHYHLLPPNVPTAAIEAGVTSGWHKWVGRKGLVIGIDHFGESAPDTVLATKFGFTASSIVERIQSWL